MSRYVDVIIEYKLQLVLGIRNLKFDAIEVG